MQNQLNNFNIATRENNEKVLKFEKVLDSYIQNKKIVELFFRYSSIMTEIDEVKFVKKGIEIKIDKKVKEFKKLY